MWCTEVKGVKFGSTVQGDMLRRCMEDITKCRKARGLVNLSVNMCQRPLYVFCLITEKRMILLGQLKWFYQNSGGYYVAGITSQAEYLPQEQGIEENSH